MKNELINPRNPWVYIAGAVLVAIVGHVTLQILTGEFRDWSFWEGVWLLSLFFLAIAVSIVSIPEISKKLSIRRGRVNEKPAVRPLGDIESAPALIVYVSANKNGPFRKPIDQFADGEESLLKHVFLVHSEQSKDVARALYQEIENDPKSGYTAHKDGLQADFNDLRDMLRVSRIAVSHALNQVAKPEDIVIDITGGTAVASAGAVLAGLRSNGVSLTYIPRDDQGNFGNVIKRVDVSLVPGDAEDHAAQEDNAS